MINPDPNAHEPTSRCSLCGEQSDGINHRGDCYLCADKSTYDERFDH